MLAALEHATRYAKIWHDIGTDEAGSRAIELLAMRGVIEVNSYEPVPAEGVMMQQEAEITVNGSRLTNNEARMVRLALASFADIMANKLGFKDDGIPLTDQYQADTAHVLALIEGRAQRTQ